MKNVLPQLLRNMVCIKTFLANHFATIGSMSVNYEQQELTAYSAVEFCWTRCAKDVA